MQIIKAGYEIFPPVDGANTLKKLERVARVCYKSEDKIGIGSHKKMVGALVNSKHYAMLEHATIILLVDNSVFEDTRSTIREMAERWGETSFLRFTSLKCSKRNIISGNIRAWLEHLEKCIYYRVGINEAIFNALIANEAVSYKYTPIFDGISSMLMNFGSDFVYSGCYCKELFAKDLTVEERLVHEDITVKFICDRGVSHEIVRHRVASFAQESTRYCNYGSKGGEITAIKPCYLSDSGEDYSLWRKSCVVAEKQYLDMLAYGLSPQEARAVLPTSLKTEVVMTANLREWRHFFSLRACGATGKPHPQMLEVALPLLKELRGIIPVVFDDLEPMEV